MCIHSFFLILFSLSLSLSLLCSALCALSFISPHSQKKDVGKFVFDQVLRHLSLPEKDKDYFGMEYEDDQKVPVCMYIYSSLCIIIMPGL